MTLNHLPADFVWGASTASYQVEGATREDGRGPSVWDTFTARPGTIRDGHTGEVACDHYHRYEQDLDLMAEAGLTGYRFSIAWPRIQPTGRGEANIKGLDFYDRLVDGLLSRGIEPVPTLFHWDLPQALEDEGGWLNRDTAHRFAEYAAIAADRLGDRVRTWITLNEPFIHMVWGYGLGTHAPGRTLFLDCLPVAHHQLLGHGLALRELRGRGLQVMISNNCTPVWPASSTPADHAAAQAYDNLHNRLFNDPLLKGTYPDLTAFGADATLDAWIQDGDLDLISAPLDALGINYYNPTRIQAPATPDGLPFEEAPIKGYRRTAFDWPVVPDGLRELLVTLKDRYPTALPPLYITENGCSAEDVLTPDGKVLDLDRIDYLDTHLQAVDAAVAQGVDVRGYFTWTLLDNFEWAEGYHQRFGLVHVDHKTQVRTPKASFAWYRDLIRAQRG
ncbi:beta-glucosidase [Streptomyces anulatus]|uniref:GH1 family beta-glucosidase n=1 Tax=Streptomyces TaxID=1883 RepID=UPI0006DAB1E1|nr:MULTISPECIES: GH1 family beta-glucosidase [Streptomyces]KPL30794.1 beta-glucosidase [Streptomyces anulatus]WTC75518.1 GH1 family beta-glucosidase [Streptomyces anulatus]